MFSPENKTLERVSLENECVFTSEIIFQERGRSGRTRVPQKRKTDLIWKCTVMPHRVVSKHFSVASR